MYTLSVSHSKVIVSRGDQIFELIIMTIDLLQLNC